MDEEYMDESFKNQLDAESLLLTHLNRVSVFRDVNIKSYCSSVETLVLMTPRKIRDKAMDYMAENKVEHGNYENITRERLLMYDRLLVFVNTLLEKDRMIWKKRSIKTYE